MGRRERLIKTLEKRGDLIVGDEGSSDTRMPECVLPIGSDSVHLCETPIKSAEKRLFDSLRKPADGLISRWINRPLSLTLTRLLMNTNIRPNHISVVTLIVGVLSGILVAGGGYVSGILGAIALQAQSVLDGVDGELSRLRFQSSKLGQWLDTISDDLADFSFLLGTTIIQTLPVIRWTGIAGLLSFVVAQTILYYALIAIYKSGDLQVMSWKLGSPKGWVEKLRFLFRHDFICLLAVILSVFNRLDIAVLLLSVGRIVVLGITLRQVCFKGFAHAPDQGPRNPT